MQRHLKDEIKRVFKNYKSFVVSIKGDWGSGKTFFWNKFKDKLPSGTKYAYVSLFGKESIEDIKRDVILQISAKDKAITSVKGKVSNIKTTFGFKDDDNTFGITGSAIGTLMSLFEKKRF